MAPSPASHNRHAGILDARYGRVYVSDKARIAGLLIAKVSGAHPQQITDFNLGFTPNETVERLREKAHRPVTTRRSRRGWTSTSCTPVIGDFGKGVLKRYTGTIFFNRLAMAMPLTSRAT
jgi:hypothetical protein